MAISGITLVVRPREATASSQPVEETPQARRVNRVSLDGMVEDRMNGKMMLKDTKAKTDWAQLSVLNGTRGLSR